MLADIGKYLPPLYDGIYEIDQIVATENVELDRLYGEIEKAQRNQYILTADEEGIAGFEEIYKIIPDLDAEDLAFRRQRVLGRASLTLPFSVGFLRGRLDEIMGAGKYELTIDHANRTLRVESAITSSNWYHEINILIGKIKPCNMVYINNPFMNHVINLSEEIGATECIYHYGLGSTWLLGQKSFGGQTDLGVIKMPEISSITSQFLENIAKFSAMDVDNVLVNDTVMVADFEIKRAEGNTAVIAYRVPEGTTDLIANIKLRKGQMILCSSDVYVPATSQVDIKHKIEIKEGM